MAQAADNLGTFVTQLSLQMEEPYNWWHSLLEFGRLIQHVTDHGLLPEPYANETPQFLTSYFLTITRKVLAFPQLHSGWEKGPVSYLSNAILLLLQYVFEDSHLELLSEVLDPNAIFFACNSDHEQSQYSAVFRDVLVSFIGQRGPIVLLNLLEISTVKIGTVVRISSIFQKIGNVATPKELFQKDWDRAISSFCAIIERLATVDDPREISLKELLTIIPDLAVVSHHSRFIEVICRIIRHFLTVQIADVQMTGIRLCEILFIQILSDNELGLDSNLNLFREVLTEARNFEALQALKTVLVRIVQKDLLKPQLIEAFLGNVLGQYVIVSQKAIDLFCGVVRTLKDPSLVFAALEKVDAPLDIYRKLIPGSKFTKVAARRLLENGTAQAFSELTKAAATTDLRFLLPDLLSRLENPALLEFCVYVISAIFQKTAFRFDVTPIVHAIATNLQIFKSNMIRAFDSLVMILQKSHSVVERSDFELLFQGSESDLYHLITRLFLKEQSSLVSEDCFGFLSEHIRAISHECFAIVRHLYLSLNSSNILAQTIQTVLWEIVLETTEENMRKLASELLLSIQHTELLPACLFSYVERCLNTLLQSESVNAAVFIRECLELASTHVDLSTLGLQPHRFESAEDNIEIPISNNGEISRVLFHRQKTVAEFLPFLAGKLGYDVGAMVLYRGGSPLPSELVLRSNDLIEIRIKKIYTKAPPFTRDNHPVSLFQNVQYIDRLFSLFKSGIAEHIYNILILVPTPESFKLDDLSQLDLSERFLFVYQLHYVAKHSLECCTLLEHFLITNFDEIVPEGRYLIVLLLNPETQNDQLVLSVLPRLYCVQTRHFLTRTIRRFWSVIRNFSIAIPPPILSSILLVSNPKFRELALASKLIQSQPFSSLWEVFISSGVNLTNLPILLAVPVSADFYESVFQTLFPHFETLDIAILKIFIQMADHWDSFPAAEIAPAIVNAYILCLSKPQTVTFTPFILLLSIMRRHPNLRTEILTAIDHTIPSVDEWNYRPEDSFKSLRVGLANLGATCYVNAVLQQLFHIPQFRDFILHTSFEDDGLQALHNVFLDLQYSVRRSADMYRFAAQWKGRDGEPIKHREQQDANEFLMLLFERLEIPGKPVFDLFAGTLEDIFSNSTEDFYLVKGSDRFTSLALPIMEQNSIADSLKLMAVPDIIKGYRRNENDPPIDVKHTHGITQLPPYLIIQLKRFDFSITSGRRSKIDQPYEFENNIDFRNYVGDSIPETQYSLIGVVVHQGDAETGHYFSYVYDHDDDWICLNDTSVQSVKTAFMRNDANGNTHGSSAYLLFYKRVNAASFELTGELGPSDELRIAEIQNDNHRLAIDTIYLSRPFAEFTIELILAYGLDNVTFKYFTDILVHSQLKTEFIRFCTILKSPDNLQIVTDLITERSQFIISVMSQCTNPDTRLSFCDLITTGISNTGPESPLLLTLLSSLSDYLPTVLHNWRNSLDFFKILYNCGSLGPEFLQTLIDAELGTALTRFLLDMIPAYVKDTSHNITEERFCRHVDLTYLLKLLGLLKLNPDVILSRDCVKWFIGSELHAKAFVEMYLEMRPQEISQFLKLIEDLSTKPYQMQGEKIMKQTQRETTIDERQGQGTINQSQGRKSSLKIKGKGNQSKSSNNQGPGTMILSQGQGKIINEGRGNLMITQGQGEIIINGSQGNIMITQGQGTIIFNEVKVK
jgi:hypothetical protein